MAPRHVNTDELHHPAPHTLGGHTVQFFDGPDTLGTAVASFLHEGLQAGQYALVVARPFSTHMIARALAAEGAPLQPLVESGRLTVVDAAATLLAFMDGQLPDPGRFATVVGTLVRQQLAASNGRLRVYGEMVEILATEGNFDGAQQLEGLWNALGRDESFELLCGYSAAHFTGVNGRAMLGAICAQHGGVHQDPSDVLASWLLKTAQLP
jgi:hypothetical protein